MTPTGWTIAGATAIMNVTPELRVTVRETFYGSKQWKVCFEQQRHIPKTFDSLTQGRHAAEEAILALKS